MINVTIDETIFVAELSKEDEINQSGVPSTR